MTNPSGNMNQPNASLNNAGIPARAVAVEILKRVLAQNTPLDQVLSSHEKLLKLDPRDRSLCRMIVMTVLRRKGQLDDLIRRTLDKPQELKPDALPILLYVGIAQICFMDVADHAAVDITVELAPKNGLSRQKGFINAVLRRIGRERQQWLETQDPTRLNIPAWLLEEWVTDYSLHKAAQISEASLIEPTTDITVKNPNDLNYWAEKLHANILPTGSLRLKQSTDITALAGFDEGEWWVQDAAAAIPARLFGSDLTGKTIVDLCAAPGGKTMQLATAGATVIAVDRSANRLKRLEENLKRTGLSDKVECIVADGAQWRPSKRVDGVLIDAPCSATGTIRRHPDIMHLKTAEDIMRLSFLQLNLMHNAAAFLNGDGILVYATCSLQKKEGEEQVERFLSKESDFQAVPILDEEIGGLDHSLNAQGQIRLTPDQFDDHGGIDGFFTAKFVKS